MSKVKITQLIRGEQGSKFNAWHAPTMDGHTINLEATEQSRSSSTDVSTPVTAQNLEQIRDAAYQEGLEKGRVEGLDAVKLENQQTIDSLNNILNSCQLKQGDFDEQICEQLVSMTIAIAKQVIRRELSVAPDEIMAVIRESIAFLPNAKDKITLKLHPEDALLVRETYQLDNESERMWTIFEDPSMQRGGCIISTDTSTVNADLDNRIAMIVTQLLGDERIENDDE